MLPTFHDAANLVGGEIDRAPVRGRRMAADEPVRAGIVGDQLGPAGRDEIREARIRDFDADMQRADRGEDFLDRIGLVAGAEIA